LDMVRDSGTVRESTASSSDVGYIVASGVSAAR
jgi:hypothetical protein